MKLRQGRKNPLNLYVQFGDEPADGDLSIGYVRDERVARWIVLETQTPSALDRLEGIDFGRPA